MRLSAMSSRSACKGSAFAGSKAWGSCGFRLISAVRPLARPHRDDPRLAEAWDLIIGGVELAPAYSELADPVEQRRRLVEQSLAAAAGDPEKMQLDEDFLRALGVRVRELRSRRGMTRKMMAQESDVSERHLAQLELGDGNVSIVLLRRIATALNVSLADLFAAEGSASCDAKRSILDLLERLPAQQLKTVATRLTKEFGATPKDRHSRIALIGLRGAGKSTLGVKLAQAVKAPLIELDREIAKEAGMDLSEIFSLYGQSGYRLIEQ